MMSPRPVLPPTADRRQTTLAILLVTALLLTACSAEPHKSDAELGLNAQQSSGRRVYEQRCAECHFAYITRSLRGPSMMGLFKKPFMSSGIPANDERVREIIISGRAKMPAFGRTLNPQQVDDLMAYLHTL